MLRLTCSRSGTASPAMLTTHSRNLVPSRTAVIACVSVSRTCCFSRVALTSTIQVRPLRVSSRFITSPSSCSAEPARCRRAARTIRNKVFRNWVGRRSAGGRSSCRGSACGAPTAKSRWRASNGRRPPTRWTSIRWPRLPLPHGNNVAPVAHQLAIGHLLIYDPVTSSADGDSGDADRATPRPDGGAAAYAADDEHHREPDRQRSKWTARTGCTTTACTREKRKPASAGTSTNARSQPLGTQARHADRL